MEQADRVHLLVSREQNLKSKRIEVNWRLSSLSVNGLPDFIDNEVNFIFDSVKKIKGSLKMSYEVPNNLIFLVLKFEVKVNFDFLIIKLEDSFNRNPSIFDMKMDTSNENTYVSIQSTFSCCEDAQFPESLTFKAVIIDYLITKQPKEFWNVALKRELQHSNLSDFTITVNENKVIKVHKLVLYYKSPVFKNLIESDMIEKKSNNINISGTSENIVQEFVNYIYFKECNFRVGVQDLFRLAHMYEVNDLLLECQDYMINNLSIEDITETLKLVKIDLYDLSILKSEAENFVRRHEAELVNDNNFIEYYLEIMDPTNVHIMFELAMKYNNREFTHNITDYIKKNLGEVLKNATLRNLLENHTNWGLNLLDNFARNLETTNIN